LHTDLVVNALKNCLASDSYATEIKRNALSISYLLLLSKTAEFKKIMKDLDFDSTLDKLEPELKDSEEAKLLFGVWRKDEKKQ
jgi:hypothetical protein